MLERISGSLLDPESLYLRDDALFHSPELRGLNLVMGFTGFADAGHVVRQITAELLDTLDSGMVAEFDADQLIDYRSRRPQISFVEDHLQDYQAPRLALYRLVDGLGSLFLLLAGFEPDLQWERFARAVVGIVEETGRQPVSLIHSIPMPVPYTRPVERTVHGNRPDLIEGISVWKPTVEVPAAVGHILELRLTEAGRNVAGYVMHVPHYLAEAEYLTAAVAGLEYRGRHLARRCPPTGSAKPAGTSGARSPSRSTPRRRCSRWSPGSKPGTTRTPREPCAGPCSPTRTTSCPTPTTSGPPSRPTSPVKNPANKYDFSVRWA